MNEKDLQLIDRFLNNELTEEELEKFNFRLKNDIDFAKEFNLYKEIDTTLTRRFSSKEQENKLKETLTSLGNQYCKDKLNISVNKPKVFSLQRYGKFLAAASLVIFVTLLWFNNSNPKFSDYNIYPNLELTVRGDKENEHIKNAEKSFNNKDYATAQKELEILLASDKTKTELQLYLAICLLEQNYFKKADSILEKITKGVSVYRDKATWYLALSKLKQKDYKSCKEYLLKIPKDASDYKNSQKLLKKLQVLH